MPDRINTPLTNEHFAAFCQSMVGQPYWYGTCVYKCTESLRSRKAAQYPSHYGSSRTSRYKDDISKKKVCADCVGLIKGYCWTGGGKGVIESIGTDKTYSSTYGGNGCPDKSANGMFSYAKSKGCSWGTMDSMPEVPGIALRSDGHVGVYIGGGYAVEERGFSYGCVKTRVKDRSWTHWYFLPFIDYGEASNVKPPQTEYALGSRLLTKGTEGNDVKQLQEHLLKLGYSLPKYGADGDFGSETEAAVRAFQKAESLEVDGKYGEKSHAALMDALSADDEAPEQPRGRAEKQPVATERFALRLPGDGQAAGKVQFRGDIALAIPAQAGFRHEEGHGQIRLVPLPGKLFHHPAVAAPFALVHAVKAFARSPDIPGRKPSFQPQERDTALRRFAQHIAVDGKSKFT